MPPKVIFSRPGGLKQVSEQEVNPNGKVIDLVLPVAVLIVSAIGAMVYTGFLGGAGRHDFRVRRMCLQNESDFLPPS